MSDMSIQKALDILNDNHTRLINFDYSDEELGNAQEVATQALQILNDMKYLFELKEESELGE